MSAEENDQLRTDIFDQIYKDGPQSVEQLAQQMQLSVEDVTDLVDHSWFSQDAELITIATND